MYESLNTTGLYPYGGEWFITHPVEIMTPIFLLFIILLILNFKTIVKSFSKVDRKIWAILLIIFLVGFWLRNAEYRYGNGYDGFFYLNCAKYMLEEDIQVWSCAMGNGDQCYLYHQHLAPAGYPYLIFLAYFFFGIHDIFAMMISGILSSLTIVLIFLFTYLFFKKERMALYASAVFALIPFDIFLSSTGSLRPTSMFFIGLTMLIYYIALKKDGIKLWSLFAITFSYALYVRQENSILLIPMIFIFLFERGITKRSFKNVNIGFLKKYWIPIVIFLISQIPLQHWILLADYGPRLFVLENFPMMSYLMLYTFFFNPIFYEAFYNPLVSLIFFSSILLLLIKKQRKPVLIIWIWFLTYFIIYSIYFQCPGFPENLCFDYLRFMQHFHIPYAILAGAVLFNVERIVKIKKDFVFIIVFIFLFFSAFLFPSSIFRLSPTIFKDGRLEEPYVGDVVNFINMTPKDSLLFTGQVIIPNFDYFQGDERVMIDINIYTFYNYSFAIQLIRENIDKPMFLIEDWVCSYPDYCKFVYDNFEWSVIDSREYVNLIRLEPKKNLIVG